MDISKSKFKNFLKESKTDLKEITHVVKLKIIHVDDIKDLFEEFTEKFGLASEDDDDDDEDDIDNPAWDMFLESLHEQGYKVNDGFSDWFNELAESIKLEIM